MAFLLGARWWVIFVAAVAATGSLGGRAAQQASPTKPTPTGVITGRVIDASSNQPVDEAVVTLSGSTGDRRVMVDPQGRYVFTNLAAGAYSIQADQFGYLRGRFSVDLDEGQRFPDATIRMSRCASITGRVVDDAGEPVARVTVRAMRRTYAAGRTVLTPNGLLPVATDDRGVFRIPKLAPGDYAVAVPARLSTFPTDIVRNALGSGISLGVSETASLGDSRYLQLGDHVIASMSSAPIPPAPLPNGQLVVFQTTFYPNVGSVDQAGIFTLAAGDERSGVEIRLTAVPTTSLSGTITDPRGPVALTPFKLVRAGDEPAYEEPEMEAATGLTDSAGRFTLLGVPRGRYEIRLGPTAIPGVGATSLPTSTPAVVAREPVVIGDAPATNVSVTAHDIPTMRGRIETANSQPPAPDSVMIIVQSFGGGLTRVVNPRVDKNGSFATLILPGRYVLLASVNGERCSSVVANGKDVGDALVPVDVDNVEVLFKCGSTPAVARVTGQVRGANGTADSSATVVVFSADRRHWTMDDYRPLRLGTTATTATAAYSLRGLPPGEYFIVAVPASADHSTWLDPKTLDTLARSAARISLAAGEARAVDLVTVTIR